MREAAALNQDLVFVGGGHSHALVLRALAMQPITGLRTTLISPASHTPYSGMLPGLVAGHYNFQQTHIDLARLCQWAGVRFIAAEATALDPSARLLSVADRPPVGYDVLSIDIGSQPELDSVPGARRYATPVKPVAGLWQRWRRLLEEISDSSGRADCRIAVVGGGAGGVELAMAIAHTLAERPMSVQLYWSGPHLLGQYNVRSRRAVEQALLGLGVQLYPYSRVSRVEAGHLCLESGSRQPFDQLFWCTGASAAPWIAESGLETDERGFLAVRDTLQSVSDDNVFGAGDIATQVNHPRPKAGVFAVRQAPVLAANLRSLLLQKPLRQYRPQRRFLSLVSLGERRAVADRGWLSVTGEWVWRWKDRIDREFMDRFDDMPAVTMDKLDSLPALQQDSGQPHCGGCGAKVGADTLSRVLARLSQRFPEHCRQADLGDDVSLIAPVPERTAERQPGRRVVQSIDVLRSLVTDPWLMGRIAANHALSDLYASGARPVSALASVTLPFASETLLERELEQLLAGALKEFSAVDCRLTGGHSLQGAEFSVGFVVNGMAWNADDHLLAKCSLRAGDKLVLTKPLGTGTLFAAHMQHRADGRWLDGAIASMLQSNAAASRLALDYQASACTDITGFGLAGHLLEMLGPDQCVRLDLSRVPLLDGALDCIAAGMRSSMHSANMALERHVQIAPGVDRTLADMVFDPQTSGGLLIGVDAASAADFCSALQAAGCRKAAVIGTVQYREGPEHPALWLESVR